MQTNFFELKKLFSFQIRDNLMIEAIRNFIEKDKDAELFFGEYVSQVLQAKEYDHSSAYLMSFLKDSQQQTHCHTGVRILFIFTKEGGSITLGNDPMSMETIPLENNSLYVLRMEPDVYHKFFGDFVAFSIHPEDKKVGANMKDETTFA